MKAPCFDEKPDGDLHGECAAKIERLTLELESYKVRHQDEVNARVNAENDLYAMQQERRREHDLRVKIGNEYETLLRMVADLDTIAALAEHEKFANACHVIAAKARAARAKVQS